jgi:ribosome recycling factor
VRDCKQIAEETRVSIRNARKDANRAIDRDEELSEDQQNAEKKRVQKLTDKYVAIVEEQLKKKTEEVMSI